MCRRKDGRPQPGSFLDYIRPGTEPQYLTLRLLNIVIRFMRIHFVRYFPHYRSIGLA
jgi:hypothetical protein